MFISCIIMDIIRRKIYNLKKESVQVLETVQSLEASTSASNEAASANEKRLRELMKAVSKKDHEVDVAQNSLEAADKKIRVAEANLKKSRDDLVILKDLVVKREIDLRASEEEAAKKNAILADVNKR